MIDDIYFKMHCLYNAKTELYDRSLTDNGQLSEAKISIIPRF